MLQDSIPVFHEDHAQGAASDRDALFLFQGEAERAGVLGLATLGRRTPPRSLREP